MSRGMALLAAEESGQTVTEYAIMLGLISIVVLGAVIAAGQSLDAAWSWISDQIGSAFSGF
ncbi:MAG: Flp family type IVb pilin [Chloroflexi bacterium]|nr:Flp family type IVb pilin [Chloroflexota bacterium]